MSSPFKIKTRVITALQPVLDDLREQIEGCEIEYDERSDRWQESDRGQTVLQWIDDMAGHADLIEEALTEIRDNLEPEF